MIKRTSNRKVLPFRVPNVLTISDPIYISPYGVVIPKFEFNTDGVEWIGVMTVLEVEELQICGELKSPDIIGKVVEMVFARDGKALMNVPCSFPMRIPQNAEYFRLSQDLLGEHQIMADDVTDTVKLGLFSTFDVLVGTDIKKKPEYVMFRIQTSNAEDLEDIETQLFTLFNRIPTV